MGKRTAAAVLEEAATEPLKRRTSSPFSIVTTQEEGDGENDEMHIVQHSCEPLPVRTVRASEANAKDSAAALLLVVEQRGLYIDEDENDEVADVTSKSLCCIAVGDASALPSLVQRPHSKITPFLEVPVPCEASFSLSPAEAPTEKASKDLRMGIVVEAAAQHFDRSNRLHKERPMRVAAIVDALQSACLLERCCVLESSPSDPAVQFLQAEDYLRVHIAGYMHRLGKMSKCTCCDRLDREAEQYQSIFLTGESVEEAKRAAAALCTLTERAVSGEIDHGFAVIRPPGHHAEPGMAGGYCLINNVAVAAAYARAKLRVGKVLIVDWDVHHGNGTQSIFFNEPSVLYFSVHAFQGGSLYPFTGSLDTVGVGDGQGYTVNVGWSHKGMGDDEYLAVWEKLLLPMVAEFDPDLVLVSAGFDAAAGDSGECNVTAAGFAELTRQLKRTLRTCPASKERSRPAPIVCTLEGGYVRSVLGQCVSAVVETLLDRDDDEALVPSSDDGEEADIMDCINPWAAMNIRQTMGAHRQYWKCLTATGPDSNVRVASPDNSNKL